MRGGRSSCRGSLSLGMGDGSPRYSECSFFPDRFMFYWKLMGLKLDSLRTRWKLLKQSKHGFGRNPRLLGTQVLTLMTRRTPHRTVLNGLSSHSISSSLPFLFYCFVFTSSYTLTYLTGVAFPTFIQVPSTRGLLQLVSIVVVIRVAAAAIFVVGRCPSLVL